MFNSSRRYVAITFLVGSTAALGGTAAAQTTTGQLHVLAVTETNGLRHAIRTPGVGWTAFGDVETTEAGDIGHVARVAATVSGIDLHVVAINDAGTLFHTIRHANEHWQPFGNLSAALGSTSSSFSSVGMATSPQGVHVCVVGGGAARHTIRLSNGSWLPWEYLDSATSSDVGTVDAIDCEATEEPTPVIHFVVSAHQFFGPFVLWHATRTASNPAVWSVLGNASQAAQFPGEPLFPSAAAFGDILHVGAWSYPTRAQQHGMRFGNGAWQPFAPVSILGSTYYASMAVSAGSLHTVAVRYSDKRLYHTSRSPTASGQWTALTDVGAATGNAETFLAVAVAGLTTVIEP